MSEAQTEVSPTITPESDSNKERTAFEVSPREMRKLRKLINKIERLSTKSKLSTTSQVEGNTEEITYEPFIDKKGRNVQMIKSINHKTGEKDYDMVIHRVVTMTPHEFQNKYGYLPKAGQTIQTKDQHTFTMEQANPHANWTVTEEASRKEDLASYDPSSREIGVVANFIQSTYDNLLPVVDILRRKKLKKRMDAELTETQEAKEEETLTDVREALKEAA